MAQPENIIYISPSQVSEFSKCSLKWYFRKVLRRLGLTTKPSSYLSVGTAVHSSIQADYESALERGELAPLDILQDIAADSFEHLSEKTIFEDGEKKDTLKDEVVGLAEFHHKELAPSVLAKGVVAVEEPLNFNLPGDGWELRVRQRPDVIVKTGVIDNKTSAKRLGNPRNPNDKTATRVDGQLSAYAIGFALKYGKQPEEVTLHRLLRYKGGPQKEVLSNTRDEHDQKRYLDKVVRIAERMQKLDVWPIDDPGYCKFCPYFEICWLGNGGDYTGYLRDPELARKEAERLMAGKLMKDDWQGRIKEEKVDG